MKIIFTADLHYPTTDIQTMRAFIAQIQEEKPDVIILGGDLGESLKSPEWFLTCVEEFTSLFDIPVLVLAGNHDLWTDGVPNSRHLWTTMLPELTKRAGAIWLEGGNHYAGPIAIVGSYLHYDYTAADKIGHAAGLTEKFWETNKKRICNDARYLVGLPSDVEFAREIGEPFKDRLEEAQLRPEIKEIIVATHVPIVDEQVTRNPHDYSWAMGTPYFGCLSYDHWVDVCSKISHLVCGHNHRYKEGQFHRCDLAMDADSVMGREKWSELQNAGIEMRGAEMHPYGFREDPRAICCGSDYGSPEFITIKTTF